MFGDKINARIQAKKAGIQYIPGSDGPVMNYEEVEKFAREEGFPIMLKAVNGGGGRGMRMVNRMVDLREAYDRAKSEAKLAFGNDEIYLEKCIVNPKHIEVQIMGDALFSAVIRRLSKSPRPFPCRKSSARTFATRRSSS